MTNGSNARAFAHGLIDSRTQSQLRSLYRLCYLLTTNEQPIYLVRVDERPQMNGGLFVLAGKQQRIEKIIERNGRIRRV